MKAMLRRQKDGLPTELRPSSRKCMFKESLLLKITNPAKRLAPNDARTQREVRPRRINVILVLQPMPELHHRIMLPLPVTHIIQTQYSLWRRHSPDADLPDGRVSVHQFNGGADQFASTGEFPVIFAVKYKVGGRYQIVPRLHHAGVVRTVGELNVGNGSQPRAGERFCEESAYAQHIFSR